MALLTVKKEKTVFLIVLIIPSPKCDSRNVSTRLTSVRAYLEYPVEAQRRCARTSIIRFHPLYRETIIRIGS